MSHSTSTTSPSSVLTRQPGKGLWTLFTILTLPAHIAIILLYNTPYFLRPNPRWTFRQAVGKAIFALWWKYASAVEYRPAKTLEPGVDGERFITMRPTNADAYRGILAIDSDVRPDPVGAMWYPQVYDPTIDADRKVAIHFHGGAYMLGGCRPMEGGWGPEVLAKNISGFVLQPQYRLAMDARSRFPAAIQDGLTAYTHLLSQGISSRNIILSGESADGNLVLALLRFLVDEGTLPPPRAALLWSPWLDLATPSAALENHRNTPTDYFPARLADWAVRMYVPPQLGARHPYISPLGNVLATTVPIFLQTGNGEVLHDSHVLFVRQMRDVKGNSVDLIEIIDAPHDTFGAGLILGFAKEAEEAAATAARFVEDSN